MSVGTSSVKQESAVLGDLDRSEPPPEFTSLTLSDCCGLLDQKFRYPTLGFGVYPNQAHILSFVLSHNGFEGSEHFRFVVALDRRTALPRASAVTTLIRELGADT